MSALSLAPERARPAANLRPEPSPPPRRSGFGRHGLSLGFGALALAAILVALPLSSAATPIYQDVQWNAPYVGGSVTLQEFGETTEGGCGAHAGFTVAPDFDLATGISNGSLTTTSGNAQCGNYTASDAYSSLWFSTPTFKATRSGQYNAVWDWNLSYTAHAAVHAGPNSTGSAFVNAYLQWWVDGPLNTQGACAKDPFDGVFVLFNQNLGPGSSHFSTSLTQSFLNEQFSGPCLEKGHHYGLTVNVVIQAYASALPGSTASASLDLSAGGGVTQLTELELNSKL
jgi:hypothetical protein